VVIVTAPEHLRAEVRDFLTTRRERITPEQAGLPFYGGTRRVKGLRREEVSMLAGVSVDYYTRLERGNLSGVSEEVLDALASALQLDEAERAHLFDLARSSNAGGAARTRTSRTATRQVVRPGVQRILDTISTPAHVRNGRFDLLATNKMGRALLSLPDESAAPFNFARYVFLDPAARDLYIDWDTVARDCVAALRIEAGRNPYDKRLTDLVGELSTRDDDFRTWWASHNVKLHLSTTKRFRHPVAGEFELTGEALELPADPGLTLVTYTYEPASPAEEALAFLASWSSNPPQRALRRGAGHDATNYEE
jgi:transcriptional regulator with XRE-family HTH domain